MAADEIHTYETCPILDAFPLGNAKIDALYIMSRINEPSASHNQRLAGGLLISCLRRQKLMAKNC